MTAVLAPVSSPITEVPAPQLTSEAAFAPLRIERLSSWTATPPAMPASSWICWIDVHVEAHAA